MIEQIFVKLLHGSTIENFEFMVSGFKFVNHSSLD
jgi:hypothetical protein